MITGCGKAEGIGAASARLLAARGFAVIVSDVAATGAADLDEPADRVAGDREGLDGLVREIRDAGGEALAVVADVSSEADVARLAEAAVAAFGSLNVLVNNAAAPFGLGHGDIEKIAAGDWDRAMAVNLKGTFLACRAAVPHMRRARWGRIVNISSAAGRAGSRANATYAAAKAGIIGFTRSLALDVAPDFITANAICPGMILTRRMRSGARNAGGGDEQSGIDTIVARTPISRPGTAEEVAAMVAYLASDEAGFVTAQAIGIDGGTLKF